jgi:inhibitor of KinA sporulation pathway (predicted exonuclease)
VGFHRQYVRPLFIDTLSDECKEISGIDEEILFSSEVDLDGALRKVIVTH